VRCGALAASVGRPPRQGVAAIIQATALLAIALGIAADERSNAAEIELPPAERTEPVLISAQAANCWQQGPREVWLLRGNCRIVQGQRTAQCREAVLWIDRSLPTQLRPTEVFAYLEGALEVSAGSGPGAARLADRAWLGRFSTVRDVQIHVPVVAGRPDVLPPIYQRAMMRSRMAEQASAAAEHVAGFAGADTTQSPQVRPAQFAGPLGGLLGDQAAPAGDRRIRVFPRGEVPVQAQWFPDPHSRQWIAVIDSGVNLIVDGLEGFGSLDVSADRLVIWTRGLREPDLTGQTSQNARIPLEVYLEGNIVFRQGERVVYADRMYYDVVNQRGTVLGAEVLTPVKDYEGLLRFRAELLQQVDRDRFFARNTFLTSSRMGRPGYRIQSGDIYFEDLQSPVFDQQTGLPAVDPETGEPIVRHERQATSRNNFLYLGPVPIFYWPTLASDLDDPTFYLRRIRVKNDSVFGFQVLTDWDAYELLGIRNAPEGTEWDLSFDYMDDRGFGHGTTFTYGREGFLGLPGPVTGLVDFWGIKDDGLDVLGLGRRALVPPKDYRWRLFWQHRQLLSPEWQLTAEASWLSDRNFLESYFEREWDEWKDQTTGVELKRLSENRSLNLSADVRLNKFYTQTDWLPRMDHYWLGQSLLRDTFTWYEHTSLGFARFGVAQNPTDPADAPFTLMPWEREPADPTRQADRSGERLATRQEIDWPLQLGPVKVVPYLLGEAAHWGKDLTDDDLQRLYWQTGLRASLPMWRATPWVESDFWNVHGLAHKVVFDAEFSFAETNRDLALLPLYDPLDDDSVEAFRRRLAVNTFGGAVPLRFDERFYAVRKGMAGWVTAPSTEVAEDLMALRMGVRQRWQTKRGFAGERRIIDWIVLDTNLTWFPDEARDNFGTSFGLLDYQFRWHLGDRLTMVSDGLFDFFNDGQQVLTLGGYLTRPPRGSLYLGMSLIEGPISHQVLSLSYTYWMSPKWISSFGMTVDFGADGNIGQNFSITRIGESLLVSAGFNVDEARDNVGVNLVVEPRFLPKGRLGNIAGARIPVAGSRGLE